LITFLKALVDGVWTQECHHVSSSYFGSVISATLLNYPIPCT